MPHALKVLKTPLTLVALLALVAIGGLWGWRNATAAVPPRAPDPCVPTNVGKDLTPEFVTIRVLNAGLNGGLAKRVSTTMRSYGFFVVKVNNSDQKMAETRIIGASKDDPEVKLAAQFFKNAKLEGDGRVDHVVDILLGDDFAGYVTNPKKSIAVNGPVCLPALPKSASVAPAPMPSPTNS